MSHTPGPWSIEAVGAADDDVADLSSGGTMSARTTGPWFVAEDKDIEDWVVFTDEPAPNVVGRFDSEKAARRAIKVLELAKEQGGEMPALAAERKRAPTLNEHGRLAVAAPALLSALEKLVHLLDIPNVPLGARGVQAAIDDARDAITDATGKRPRRGRA